MNTVSKVLLCSPGSYDADRLASTPPMMLVSNAAAVEAAFPDIDVLIGPGDIETLDAYQPDIIGISCFSASWERCKALAEECQRRGIGVVVGGPHINVRPQDIIPAMNVAVRGEGEQVLPRLLKCFSGRWQADDLKTIPGLLYWPDDAIQPADTGAPRAILNLDDIPMALLPPRFVQDGTLHVMTTRGCPFKCTFCATPSHDNVRCYSPEYVTTYIKRHIEQYPHITRVKIWDDLFTLNRRRVKQMSAALVANKLTHLGYEISVRADHITPLNLEHFHKMNVTDIYMGLESGSPETLKYINKHYDLAAIERAMDLLKDEPFTLHASFVIAFAHEGHQHLQETYDLIRSAPLSLIQVFLLTPYPGTIEWQQAKSLGIVEDRADFEWALLDQDVCTGNPKQVLGRGIVVSQHLSREDLYRWLLRFRRQVRVKRVQHALRLLFRNPQRFMYNLKYNSPLRHLRTFWSGPTVEHR